MSKALAVLKLFFSMVSINSTAKPEITNLSQSNASYPTAQATQPVPLLLKPIDQVACFVGQGFRFKIPDDTFYPTFYVGRKENLQLSMFTINRGRIFANSWIRFDSASRYVYGFPLDGNEGKFSYLLRATNSEGKSAEEVLRIHVRENTGVYNHEFVFRTKFKLATFVSNVLVRLDFVSRFARHAIADVVGSVWLKSYDEKLQKITIVLNTVPYSPCEKTLLQNIHRKLETSSGEIQPEFEEALSKKFPISSVALKLMGPCYQEKKEDDDGFQWGVLKHLMPILMLLFIIGGPVGIAVVIRKRSEKKRLKLRDERKRRQRMEDKLSFTFHTVHYNNRYPSMLSISNNSREENVNEDEKSSNNSKLNIIPNGGTPNGSLPSSVNLAVPNADIHKPSNNKSNSNAKTNTFNLESGKKRNSSASRVVYMGKSEMDIPVYFTKPKEEVMKNDTELSSFAGIAQSISSTLKGIGKSMLNVAGQGEECTSNKTYNLEEGVAKGDKEKKLTSELKLPLAVNTKDDLQHYQSVGIAQGPAAAGLYQRCQSEIQLSDYSHKTQAKHFYETNNVDEKKGSLINSASSRLSNRRVSLPLIYIHSESNHNTVEDKYLSHETQSSNLTLKSVLKKSWSEVSETTMVNDLQPELGEGLSICELTNQIEQMSRDAREEFGSRNKSKGSEEHAMEDSKEHQLEETYNTEDDLTVGDLEAMDYTTWRMLQIKKAERAAKKIEAKEHGIQDTEYSHNVDDSYEDGALTKDCLEYQDYTNPYQYANGSCLSVRSQSTNFASHSSDLSWIEDYEKENCYKQQPRSSSLHSYNTQSMPSLNDAKFSYAMDQSRVDNRSKTQENNSILGKLFSREKTEENRNLNQPDDSEEGSLVGFLKTRVGGLLGPSEGGSSWFK